MLLSICIPTYNREKYIGTTLRSALSQRTPEVEIVVCDNASNDATEAVVEELFKDQPSVRYFRWDRNMGADKNFLKVVELATGKYCWFMGSDDILEPGSIAHVLAVIQSHGELTGMSLNRNAYNLDLSSRIFEHPIAGGTLQEEQLFTDASETFVKLGEYFGYLPGQVVNRARWQQIVAATDVAPYLNAYVHVYVIGRMLQANPRWLYVSRPCVGWRSGNDSFMSEGQLRRIAIDVVGLERIARDLFGVGSAPYREMARSVVGNHVFAATLNAKIQGAPFSFFWHVFVMCFKSYWWEPQFWLRTLPLLLTPRSALRVMQTLYRRSLKKSRLARLK